MIFGIDRVEIRNDLALVDASSDRRITYQELEHLVNERKRQLPLPKSLIFHFCRNSVDAVVWYLAALEAGHAVALLDANQSAELRQPLLDAYQPDIVISPAGMVFHEYASGSAPYPDLSLLLSTSGTTGNSKFVRLTRRNLEANAQSICQALDIQPQDRAISSLPITYSYGLSVIHTHLAKGASTVLTDEGLMSSGFWNAFRTYECTSLAGVPYSYQMLKRLRLDTMRVPSLTTLTQAGGKLHDELVMEFHSFMASRNGRFFVMYGQTEATARISVLPHSAIPDKLGSAGLPIPNGHLKVSHEGELTTEPGIPGELVYSGPNVMMGYADNRADLAKGDELNGCLFTGDIGQLDADGYVYLAGRGLRDAKLFGLRINLDDIENLMRVYGPSAVIAKTDKLIIFCEQGNRELFTRYQRELAAKLHMHFAAFEFRQVEQLPLNTSGKIDYRKLAAAT